MKRLVTLAIMVAFILGTVGMAKAIEFKASGDWQIGINAVKNPNFDSDEKVDEFMATTRVRTTFEFIANENLRGVMRIHSGDRRWGAEGIGREDDTFEYDRAYLDFMIPNSPVNMKVGKQPVTLPNTLGSHIFDESIWGVTMNTPITDEVGINIGWLRQQDIVTAGGSDLTVRGKNDELDYFYAITPITMDGFQINPFFVYGMAGSSAYAYEVELDEIEEDTIYSTRSSYVYWAGLNFTVDMFDPIVVKGDFNYGRHSSDQIGVVGNETRGWIAALAAQYHMDMVTPEVFFMYESGHDDDYEGPLGQDRGGVMPSIAGDLFGVSTFAMSGSPLRGIGRATLNNYAGISAFGPSGKMAIGAKLGDISFLDDVTHDLQVTYYQGTNDKDLRDDGYFTTRDKAWEVTFDTHYQMYENLAAILELGYIAPSLSEDNVERAEDDDAWKAAAGFRYLF
ncbi:outer membrane homotrimeric porin [Desulfonatronospira sp.]|uniref:outer membrane homotrimeric porin n=1 Tax=Desulfonatronospira sp. TaxID=1962951 RepID=UPI0025B8DC7B|nr:outer membrane homotrimeric porin [Desulfonatronospira sp.]